MILQRRLSDKIIAAHKQACDGNNHEVAGILLHALEVDLSAIGGDKKEYRESMEHLEQAFRRHQKMLKEV